MKRFYKLILLVFISTCLGAQNQARVLGAPCKDCDYSQKTGPFTPQNGNGTINTSYTVSACGLNFTQASVRLHQRTVAAAPPTGVAQPATFSITGIPPCATITKAFLYAGTSGNGVPITANITNPLSSSLGFPMAVIGTHIDKCWSYSGTFTYRADVTSIISGNGNYTISGLPVAIGSNDTDGATLIIIYSDPTQNYTGSFVIADGAWASTGGTLTKNISGFNVCATPTLTSHFIIAADLQQIGNSQVYLNSSSSNYMFSSASQSMWNFIQAPGAPFFAGQVTANYGITNTSDCFAIAAAGAYYRTSCLSCTASPGFSVTVASTSSCTVGSATAIAVGGVGPYTYTWSPTGGNSSIATGVPPGIYTVAVKDASCGIATRTINIPGSPTVSVGNSTICSGANATLTASGASTYSWSTGATTSQIIVSPTTSTNYTVTGSNGSCNDTKTVSVTVNASPTVNIATSNTIMCAGQSATLTASGGNSYQWSTGSTNTVIVVAPISTTTYTVTGFVPGCSATRTISIAISALPSVSVSSSNSLACSGNSATLTVSGTATSYTWSTGATTSQIVVSPSVSTIYTVVGSNGVCSVSRSISIASGISPTMTAMTSNSFICAGQTVTLSTTGAVSYTYNPGGITGNPIALNPSSNITYTVVGTNGGPCVGLALITQSVSACTGISQSPVNSLLFGVYPNPNKGEFVLSLTNLNENNFVEIYNSIGQLVKKQTVKETTNKISIYDQPDGVYYLRIIQNENQVYSTRIIKE